MGWLVATTFVLGAGVVQAQGDVEEGAKAFEKCQACHVVDQEKNKLGPHLVGIFGRQAGALEGFRYSGAMKHSGIVWDDDTLATYLANPRGFSPGNRMAFAGLNDEQEIEDLLAYLREATGGS